MEKTGVEKLANNLLEFRQLSVRLVLAFLLFFVLDAIACPTGVTGLSADVSSESVSVPSHPVSSYADLLDKPACAELAKLAQASLRPPQNGTDVSPLASNSIKSLPSAPASFLMLLLGFLCVSLHRDRRVWLAAFMAPLLLSQASIHALPRLTRCFKSNHHATSSQLHKPFAHSVHRTLRLRCDIEGLRYTGLLHFLAGIPKGKSPVTPQLPQSAVILQEDVLPPLSDCAATIAEQLRFFSPAFIFQNLARGPPSSRQN